MRLTGIIILSLLVFLSCDRENAPDCLKKTGNIATKTIELDSFSSLEVYDLFKVVLIQDSVDKLVIKGGQNVIPKVEITETDTALIIENLNTCNWTRSYQEVVELQLHFTALEDVAIYGQVDISNQDTINTDYFKIIFYSKASKANMTFDTYLLNFQVWSGTGEYFIHGKTIHNWIYSGRYAYIYASDFESKKAHIENESTGDISINVTDELQAWVTSFGDIIYTGEPKLVIEELSSTGGIIKQNN